MEAKPISILDDELEDAGHVFVDRVSVDTVAIVASAQGAILVAPTAALIIARDLIDAAAA